MENKNVVLVGGVRTPIGKYGGSLRRVPVFKLGALVLEEVLARTGLEPGCVGEVVAAQSYQNGECANAARMSLLAAGWPDTIPAVTLDRRCCSGLEAVLVGAMKIQSGYAEIVVAMGVESMSQAEFYLPGDIKWGMDGRIDEKLGVVPRGHGALSMWGIPFYDRIQRARVMSQPIERYGELNSMMAWVETIAADTGISRQEADAWGARSHQRAVAAQAAGKFAQEIVPVSLPGPKGQEISFDTDETPRADATLEKLARLRPVYEGGVCTPGNSSSENDGAAAVVLASESKAKELGLEILAYLEAGGYAACDPIKGYDAPSVAAARALDKAGIGIDDVSLFEIQEAFAVQVLSDARMMNIKECDRDRKINVNGSGISLGHPIGATGVMRLVTLLHEMRRSDAVFGLETICGGGGQAIAGLFHRK